MKAMRRCTFISVHVHVYSKSAIIVQVSAIVLKLICRWLAMRLMFPCSSDHNMETIATKPAATDDWGVSDGWDDDGSVEWGDAEQNCVQETSNEKCSSRPTENELVSLFADFGLQEDPIGSRLSEQMYDEFYLSVCEEDDECLKDGLDAKSKRLMELYEQEEDKLESGKSRYELITIALFLVEDVLSLQCSQQKKCLQLLVSALSGCLWVTCIYLLFL